MFEDAGQRHGVDHSMLFEMFGGKMSASLEGRESACMKEFSPNSARVRDYYIKKWTDIVAYAVERVIQLHQGAVGGE